MGQEDRKRNFEKPSFLWRLEDLIKNLFGESIFYASYVNNFQLKGNESVLDFGCGGGIGSRCIAKKLSQNGHLTCVDISSFWISKARKRLRNYTDIDFILGDITKLDVPDCSYDVISIFYVLHDIEPDKRQDTVNCLSKKLKEHGRLYISEPTKPFHGITPDEILRLMSQAGLSKKSDEKKKSSYIAEFNKC